MGVVYGGGGFYCVVTHFTIVFSLGLKCFVNIIGINIKIIIMVNKVISFSFNRIKIYAL